MYTPTQLEAIRIFGKKDLSFGCICEVEGRFYKYVQNTNKIIKNHSVGTPMYADGHIFFSHEFGKILGHEPHLEDVFRVSNNKGINMSLEMEYDGTHEIYISWGDGDGDITIPYNPTIPLLEQSESTLQQLISLFE